MFTGIVEDRGTVISLSPQQDFVRLVIESSLDLSDTLLGDSIAVDGVCLTVVELEHSPTRVSFDVGPESLQVTALSRLKPGVRVHLERAMALGGRLGGHLVQGHVDGVGTVQARTEHEGTLELRVELAPELLRLCIHKGSITLDGVSLTINALHDKAVDVWLIPHTLERTNLGERAVGDLINIENDLIGKYVERLLGPKPEGGGVTWDLLAKSGFTG
jgi:riboflavin synthase